MSDVAASPERRAAWRVNIATIVGWATLVSIVGGSLFHIGDMIEAGVVKLAYLEVSVDSVRGELAEIRRLEAEDVIRVAASVRTEHDDRGREMDGLRKMLAQIDERIANLPGASPWSPPRPAGHGGNGYP